MSQSDVGRTDGGLDAASVATEVADAPFVRVVARASGDAVAAAGLLGRVLASRGTPFQVSVGRTIDDRTRRVEDAAPGDVTVVVGESRASDALHLDPEDEPASVAAWRLAGELGATADSVLALVGVAAAGVTPGAGSSARLVESAEAGGRLDRRPGVAGPVDDVVDALAHSTLVHASFSGDEAAAREGVAALSVDADLVDGPVVDGERIFSPRRVTGKLIPKVTLDLRDSPLNPSKGIYAQLQPELVSGDAFSPQVDTIDDSYIRLTAKFDAFIPLWDQTVLAQSFRAGQAIPLFGRETRIPPDERYFLGGAASVRATSGRCS